MVKEDASTEKSTDGSEDLRSGDLVCTKIESEVRLASKSISKWYTGWNTKTGEIQKCFRCKNFGADERT